jgi:Secretion system C-terminal sorting domain
MKNTIKIMLCLSAMAAVHLPMLAQGGLKMDGAVRMVCSGSPVIVVENGKWTATANSFVSATSNVKFTGNATTANSTIVGSNSNFHNLEIDKSSNDLQLVAATTTVKNNLSFSNGKLDLSSRNLVLATTNGQLVGESETKRTYGGSTGNAAKSKLLNNPSNNPGNLGMVFTVAGNLGLTTVSRFHSAQSLPTGNSITKYWNASAAFPSGWSATLRFNYFDAELNANNEANLVVWRSTNNGASWTEMGFTTRDPVANYVELTAVADVSGRWTLGAASGPLHDPLGNRSFETENPVSSNSFAWLAFPNPTAGMIHFSINAEHKQAATLVCSDLLGRVVFQEKITLQEGQNTLSVDARNWPSGNYVANLLETNGPTIQFVKY